MVGTGAHLKPIISCIEALGTKRGFFPKPEKLQFVQAPGVSKEVVMVFTSPLECIHGEGARQLGSFLGSD